VLSLYEAALHSITPEIIDRGRRKSSACVLIVRAPAIFGFDLEFLGVTEAQLTPFILAQAEDLRLPSRQSLYGRVLRICLLAFLRWLKPAPTGE